MDTSRTRQIVQLVSAILLFIGLFLPVLELRWWGPLRLFSQEISLAIVVLVVAVISFVLAIQAATRWVPLLGVLALLAVIGGLVGSIHRVSAARDNPHADEPNSRNLALALGEQPPYDDMEPGLKWGWVVLFVGALGLCGSFFIPAQTERVGVRTGPGRYRIMGFERDTGTATTVHIHAESREDAEAKAVADGIIVTACEFDPVKTDPMARFRSDQPPPPAG